MNLYIVILILLVLLAAVGLEVWRELHFFKTTHYSVESEHLSGLRKELNVLFLSDLHNCAYGNENERLLRSIRDEDPDLILIGGDMLVGKAGIPYETALHFVGQLPEICPTVYANGNHELRMKEEPENYEDAYRIYKNSLEKRGVHFLEDSRIRVELGDASLQICGLELPSSSYRKFRKDRITASDIEEHFGFPASADVYTILLAHNPAYMDAYLEWGADMVLSGHLHGGLIRVPGIGGIVTPQGFLFPRYSGEMTRKGSQTVIVSRGLGTHTLNIRLFNTPELISIQLGGDQ